MGSFNWVGSASSPKEPHNISNPRHRADYQTLVEPFEERSDKKRLPQLDSMKANHVQQRGEEKKEEVPGDLVQFEIKWLFECNDPAISNFALALWPISGTSLRLLDLFDNVLTRTCLVKIYTNSP